jgi:hypothetical protein
MRIEITADRLLEAKDASVRIVDALDRDFSTISFKLGPDHSIHATLTFPDAAPLTDAASACDGSTLPPSSPARSEGEPQ